VENEEEMDDEWEKNKSYNFNDEDEVTR